MPMSEALTERPSTAQFLSTFLGTCVLAGDPDYDQARAVWNAAAADLTPQLIARPHGAAGVAQAVRFAVRAGLPIAVRSGGHSPAGFGTVDGGVVIDLSAMRGLDIDPETRWVRLEPGLTWGEVAGALHEHGLAITAGDVSTVGVGGLTQGGGIGWFVRKHGLAVDRLRAAELVTADGRQLRCSETEHPEVFWALRGAGANLGVITALEFEAHEAGLICGGMLLYDASNPEVAARLMSRVAESARRAPDELTLQALLMAAPPAPFVPPHLVGQTVLMVLGCYSGDLGGAEAALAPLRALGPVVDLMGPMPYPALLGLSAEGEHRGFRQISRSGFLRELDEATLQALLTDLGQMAPGLMLQLRPLGGQLARVADDATAFSHRQAPFLLLINQTVLDPAMAEVAGAGVERLWARMAPLASGLYGNFVSGKDLNGALPAYRPGTLERIARVKAQLDPHNVFARNVNVRPATPELALTLA